MTIPLFRRELAARAFWSNAILCRLTFKGLLKSSLVPHVLENMEYKTKKTVLIVILLDCEQSLIFLCKVTTRKT